MKTNFKSKIVGFTVLFTGLFSATAYSQIINSPVFTNFVYEGNDKIYTDNPLKPGEFYNPILQGCYPDPSITRKGDDYYLVTSTFAMFPGSADFSFERFGELETNWPCARPCFTTRSARLRNQCRNLRPADSVQ